MKGSGRGLIAAAIFAGLTLICTPGYAELTEVSPHIYTDPMPQQDWYLNGQKNVIFVGYGSPIDPKKKTHYIARNTIKFGKMQDGRLLVKCNFYNSYEIDIIYAPKKPDGSHRARFYMRDAIVGNDSPLEIDSVLAPFNGADVDPFPALKTSPIPARVVEILYNIVRNEKYYGDLSPDGFAANGDILNPYTPDLYERCKK